MTEPTIVVPVDDVLELLDHGNNWIQGTWEGEGGKLCLHGAIRRCQEQPGDAYLIEQVAAKQGWGTGFNDGIRGDDHAARFDTLKQVFVEHREVTDEDLLATFGPQWPQVVALVRRSTTLTGDEIRALVDAAAVDAAVDAADADAAADAAAAAAAAAAAVDAVGYHYWWRRRTAWALACRHLTGDTFTQAQYDLLTRPWATVIGPVHPDDTPVQP